MLAVPYAQLILLTVSAVQGENHDHHGLDTDNEHTVNNRERKTNSVFVQLRLAPATMTTTANNGCR